MDECFNISSDDSQNYNMYSNVKVTSHNDYINANFVTVSNFKRFVFYDRGVY